MATRRQSAAASYSFGSGYRGLARLDQFPERLATGGLFRGRLLHRRFDASREFLLVRLQFSVLFLGQPGLRQSLTVRVSDLLLFAFHVAEIAFQFFHDRGDLRALRLGVKRFLVVRAGYCRLGQQTDDEHTREQHSQRSHKAPPKSVANNTGEEKPESRPIRAGNKPASRDTLAAGWKLATTSKARQPAPVNRPEPRIARLRGMRRYPPDRGRTRRQGIEDCSRSPAFRKIRASSTLRQDAVLDATERCAEARSLSIGGLNRRDPGDYN